MKKSNFYLDIDYLILSVSSYIENVYIPSLPR